ncbi:alpha/beta hydrolase [Rhizorhabdus wittichii]|jgi:acetyl esterase/lipase|uniref:Alpha/beta hydrolase n=1 Tax=Rhizorhabdus wittichii TaxID=160791 RepID=A0A975HCH8_9SPHN|nr:alpha/beta hydrolase [Rhizorhabdus wittichii]QTH20278.1 alpha/beta hydrolase [Rhizorhabdus wittichii]
MVSKESQNIIDLYKSWKARSGPDTTITDLRELFEEWSHLTREPGGVDYIEVMAGSVPAMWIVPKDCSRKHVLLCSHGGGYVGGSMYAHRKFFAQMAKAVGCIALNVDYRLAPEHMHPTPVQDMTEAYRWLIESEGHAPENIALIGDSAGGALALTNIENIRRAGLPTPGATMPMSPWCCGDHSGQSYQTNHENDVLTDEAFSEELANIVLGANADRKDPLSNPLYIDYGGFPPIYIQVGGYEAIVDDSRRIAEKAKRDGADVKIDVFPEMQHCFQLMAGKAPEADDAIHRFAGWVRPILGLNSKLG